MSEPAEMGGRSLQRGRDCRVRRPAGRGWEKAAGARLGLWAFILSAFAHGSGGIVGRSEEVGQVGPGTPVRG